MASLEEDLRGAGQAIITPLSYAASAGVYYLCAGKPAVHAGGEARLRERTEVGGTNPIPRIGGFGIGRKCIGMKG
jgi:hypothetical protein